MLDRFYSLHRIAGVVFLLLSAAWLADSHDSHGQGSRDNASQGSIVRSSRPLMGTTFNLSVWARLGNEPEAAEAIQRALDRVASLEGTISSWNSDSETTLVNQAAGARAVRVSPELHDLIDVSLSWSQRTEGAFDITAGPLLDRWKQARREGILPTDAEIRGCLQVIGHDHVILQPREVRLAKAGMQIGFGAIGKGYAADLAGAMLRERGFKDFIIDAGGDVLVSGAKGAAPWQIAIRHPRRPEFLAVCGVRDCAIATSGDYEQFTVINGIRYAHILDPRTGWPAREVASVTVITQHAIDADAMATALFVMGTEEGMALVEGMEDTEALMVLDSGATRMSKGLSLDEGCLRTSSAERL